MTYTYKYTDKKGGTVEIEHPMSEDSRTEHLGRPVKRIITNSSPVFYRGTGFYITDYKDK